MVNVAEAHLLVSQHRCGAEALNLGVFDNVNMCAGAVFQSEQCRGLPFMYPTQDPSLGCVCCSSKHDSVYHVNWDFIHPEYNVYRADNPQIEATCAK